MCLSLLACLCPPLAVCFKKGCGSDLFANFCLTILFWFPGCLHACCVIHKEEESKAANFNQSTVINMVHPPAPLVQQQQPQVVVHDPNSQFYSHAQMHSQPMPMPYPQPNYPSAPMNNEPPPMYPAFNK